MNEIILISIIVPVYNIEKYVKKCIESIMNQTYRDIEILLVDDGSQDQSGLICDSYAQEDKRIHVIHKANGGLSDARNCGLDMAHGDFIIFVDGDDYIAPTMCEKLLAAVLENKTKLGICNFERVTVENGAEPVQVSPSGCILRNKVLSARTIIEEKVNCSNGSIWVVSWNKIYRKELFEDLRFPVGKVHEDEFIFLDLFSKCDFVSCVEDTLYYYVRREESITKSQYSVRRLDACEAYFQRGEKMIRDGYSSNTVYITIVAGLILLRVIFERGLDKDYAYKARYREILNQFRKLGFIRMLQNAQGLKRKLFIVSSYINPKLGWRLRKNKEYLEKGNQK